MKGTSNLVIQPLNPAPTITNDHAGNICKLPRCQQHLTITIRKQTSVVTHVPKRCKIRDSLALPSIGEGSRQIVT